MEHDAGAKDGPIDPADEATWPSDFDPYSLPDAFAPHVVETVDFQYDHLRWATNSLEGAFQTIRRSAAWVATTAGVLAGLMLQSHPSGWQITAAVLALFVVAIAGVCSFPTRWNDPTPLRWQTERWHPVQSKRAALANLARLYWENARALKSASTLLQTSYWFLAASGAIVIGELIVNALKERL